MRTSRRVGFFYFLTTTIIAIAFVACLGFFDMATVFASEETGEPVQTEDEFMAFGDDTEPTSGPIVLRVFRDNDEIKAFTMDELMLLGTETHNYSAFNSFPTPQIMRGVTGIALDKIITEAGIELTNIGDNQAIDIIASDGTHETFLKGQIFAERQFFPNVMNEAGRQGRAPLSSSWSNSAPVPPMITVEGIDGNDDSAGRFIFGQLSPTEQNKATYLKYILRSSPESGKIVIHTGDAGRWSAIKSTKPSNGSFVPSGTAITINRSANNDPIMFSDRYCVYYTTDGSEPTLKSNIYNYNNYNFGYSYEKFNKPVISGERRLTIKTKVIGYGMQDSAVSSFTFTGYQPPAAPRISKIKKKGKKISLKWTKVQNARGYVIYRATNKNGPYVAVKTIGKNSTLKWTNKKLKKKKTYYYKICSYRVVYGRAVYGGYSAVKSKKIK